MRFAHGVALLRRQRDPIATALGLRTPPWVNVASILLTLLAVAHYVRPAEARVVPAPRTITAVLAPIIVRAPTRSELRADTIARMLIRRNVDSADAARWAHEFVRYGEEVRVSPKLLVAIAYAESEFKPWAHSSAGAIGLMQVVPARSSWRELEGRCGRMSATRLRDPHVNICFGSHIFRSFLNEHHGDSDRALSAYNNGTGELNGYSDRVYTRLAMLRHGR